MSVRLDSLYAIRTAAGLSLNELARAANVSVWLLSELEHGGACTTDEAGRIAAALNTDLATLGQQSL